MTVSEGDNRPGREGEAPKVLPNGYRQGVITAITVMLGFTLYFFQFWSFEAEGDWTIVDRVAALLLLLSAAIQSMTLWRSLQVADDLEPVYRRTLQWFLAGMVTMIVAVVFAVVGESGLF
jgi:hypothetical protein